MYQKTGPRMKNESPNQGVAITTKTKVVIRERILRKKARMQRGKML